MHSSTDRVERRRIEALRRHGLTDEQIASIPPRHRPASSLPASADPILDSVSVRQHVGDVSEMTLWRWEQNQGFPRPDLVINRRKYWRLSTVDRWLDGLIGEQNDAA
jgi:hypothetical protein